MPSDLFCPNCKRLALPNGRLLISCRMGWCGMFVHPVSDELLNARHAERIAWDRVCKAVSYVAPHLTDEERAAVADAYTHDFAERVKMYTAHFNAVGKDIKND